MKSTPRKSSLVLKPKPVLGALCPLAPLKRPSPLAGLGGVPATIELLEAQGAEVAAFGFDSAFNLAEAGGELLGGGAHRGLGVDALVAGDVDQREQEVAELLGGL